MDNNEERKIIKERVAELKDTDNNDLLCFRESGYFCLMLKEESVLDVLKEDLEFENISIKEDKKEEILDDILKHVEAHESSGGDNFTFTGTFDSVVEEICESYEPDLFNYEED